MKILAATLEDFELFQQMANYAPTANFKAIKMLMADDSIGAMVGYDNWTPNAVQMHIWIKNPEVYLSRDFVREAFLYPFVQGDRGLVIGVTPGDNTRALEFNRKIGFKETYRVVDGWSPGTDMVIQEMRREACRWIPR